MKNRIQQEELELMRSIAESNLKSELTKLEELFAFSPSGGNKYADSLEKRARDIKGQMGLIKELCSWISGAVHPTGHNTKDETDLAAEMVASVRKRMEESGVLNK